MINQNPVRNRHTHTHLIVLFKFFNKFRRDFYRFSRMTLDGCARDLYVYSSLFLVLIHSNERIVSRVQRALCGVYRVDNFSSETVGVTTTISIFLSYDYIMYYKRNNYFKKSRRNFEADRWLGSFDLYYGYIVALCITYICKC